MISRLYREGQYAVGPMGGDNIAKAAPSSANEIANARNIELHDITPSEDVDGEAARPGM